MTDPELADRTYVEPLTVDVVAKIIERERPDAVLPTVGGQTALNLAIELEEHGVLAKYGVKLIGASVEAIKVAEDRQLFRNAMTEIGIDTPASAVVKTLDEAMAAVARTGFPSIIRPSFTMGGVGGGIAYNVEEFREIAGRGLSLSPIHEVLIEQSVIGWKEFELEVMRDVDDNFVVICSIENIDPMGVHTGDSITVAPALTLTDKEYQRMRDAARRIIRRVGVETGGSNIQFAINPEDGAAGRDRDEPARLAIVGAGLEGHRLPDRQDRRQARARLSPRRDPERHHPRHAGVVRADHRLRRRQDPALGVREVPAGRRDADHADEVGRRGDGHRPHLQAGVPQGHPLARARQPHLAVRPAEGRDRRAADGAAAPAGDPERSAHVGAVPRPRARLDDRADPRADQDRPVVPGAVRRHPGDGERGQGAGQGRADPEAAALPEAPGLRRQRPRAPGRLRRGRDPVAPPGGVHRARLQAHRHLRRRVRVVHAVSLQQLRPGVRSGADGEEEGRHPRQRAEPHRPGHRVRLLLLSRRLRPARRRLRDGDGQLQPGDGLDRLRHGRSAVLRAADLRGRDVDPRHRALGRRRGVGASCSSAARRRSSWRCRCRRPASSIIGTSPDSIDLAEDRERFSTLLNELQIPQPQNGMAVSKDEALEVARGIGYPGGGAAVLRARRPGDGHRLRPGRARALHDQRRRRLAGAADPDRSLPRGRLRARRRRARRRPGQRRHRRRDGAHRGGRHPLRRQLVRRPDLPRRREAPADDPRLHAPHRAGARRSSA